MNVEERHEKLLLAMGIKEEDFRLFDGKTVTYEFDEKKGFGFTTPTTTLLTRNTST